MKKFFSSLRTFVLAATALIVSGVSAQITSIPASWDFEDESVAPFVGSAEGVAVISGNASTTKVFGAVNGTATATFAVGEESGAYTIGNGEEVTVSFKMFNGWLSNGKNITVSLLNSEGVSLASIAYNCNNCNFTDIQLGGVTAMDFAAFSGQSYNEATKKSANGFNTKNNTQDYVGTDSSNPFVTIKVKENGEVSLNVVYEQKSINNTYTATLEGVKMDLASITINNPNNNGDRATYIDNLAITTRSTIAYHNDYETGDVTWTSGNTGRYVPVIAEEENGNHYVDAGIVGNGNNGTTLTSTELVDKMEAGKNFTLSFRMKLAASTNQAATALNIMDAANTANILSFAEVTTNATSWTINGDEKFKATVSGGGGTKLPYWITVVLTYADGKEYLTLKDEEGNIIDGFDKTVIPTLTEAGGLGKMTWASSRYYATFNLDDMLVRDAAASDIPETPFYDYTVKYETAEGETVKDPVTRNDMEGAAIELETADKATVVKERTQYVYVSDDSEGKVVTAEGTVVTVLFEKSTVTDYTVTFKDAEGTELKPAATHKNVKVGTEVSATAAEVASFVSETSAYYNYVSGNNPITLVDDAAANVINLVFAPVEGVTAHYYQNYESGATDGWKVAAGGRYDPVVVNGATVPSRQDTYSHTVDSIGKAADGVTDSTFVITVIDSVVTVPFGMSTRFLTVNQANRNNNGTTLTGSAISVDEAEFTLEAKLLLGSSNDQTGTNLVINNKANDKPILKLAQKAGEKSTNLWAVNDDTENYIEFPHSGTYTGTTNDNLSNYNVYSVKVTVSKGLTFLSIPELGIDKQQINTLADTYGVGNIVFATSRYNANFGIDDVLVRNVLPADLPSDLETVEVTFNFVDEEGAVAKEPVKVEFQKDAQVEVRDLYKESFKTGSYDADSVFTAEYKYIYKSDNSAEVTAAEGAEVNIVFRKTESVRLVLRYKTLVDGVATNTNVPVLDAPKGQYFEGDQIYLYSPLYVWINGKDGKGETPELWNGFKQSYEFRELYTVPNLLNSSGKYATKMDYPVTVTPAAQEEKDSLGNVLSTIVYFSETENIEGMTVVNDTYTQIRMSNGKAGSAIGGKVLVTTLEAGAYTITSSSRSGVTNFVLGEDSTAVFTIESGGAISTATSGEIVLHKSTPLYIADQVETKNYNDYVLIRKLNKEVLDLGVLETAIAEGKAAAEAAKFGYQAEAKAALEAAIAEGEEVLAGALAGDPVTAEMVEEAAQKINAAIEALNNVEWAGLAYVPAAEDGETTQYLMNIETGAFLVGANDWETRASVAPEKGNPVKMLKNADGKWRINNLVAKFGDWRAVFADNGSSIWVDNNNGANVNAWELTAQEDGTYTISNTAAGAGVLGINYGWNDTRLYLSEEEGRPSTWAFITPEDYEVYITTDEYQAAIAKFKVDNIYKLNEEAVPAVEEFLANNNVAAPSFVAQYDSLLSAFYAGTLTEVVANPNAITGWRGGANNLYAKYLTSAWDVKVPDAWDTYHVNTWSTEGSNDGSNFTVPFIEYWTGDAESLAAKTMTAVQEGLEPGLSYGVSAWVRVRVKNGSADPYGISFQANDGEAIDVCVGEQVGESPFYIMTVSTTAVADAEGKISVKFNVDADNSVSWLAFKNVKYTEPVEIGEVAFNVDDDPFYGLIELGALEANGLVMNFPEAKNITPDMTIKVVADLGTLAPKFGEETDPGFGMPEFQTVLSDVEFLGDAMFGAPVVNLTDFVQYISEAGAGAYMVDVKSIEVLSAAGSVVASWTRNQEEGEVIGTVFEVKELLSVEATAQAAQTEADEYGDQHYQVVVTIENSDNEITAAGVAYAYTEGVKFSAWDEEASTMVEFTFACDATEGVEVKEDENVELVCTDAAVSQTTDATFEGELRAEGTYEALCEVVLLDEDFAEVGKATFYGEIELSKELKPTGITNVAAKFNVKDVIYTINGVRVNAPVKGINIVNGKKVLVK